MAKLDDTLAALATMSPAQLAGRWLEVHSKPSPHWSPDLLRLGIAYELQCRAAGIKRGREGATKDRSRRRSSASPLKLGTRLMRSWHGRTIAVLVVDGGFEFEERRYPSLTAIARDVTGAAWSGPRFFGLTGASGRG